MLAHLDELGPAFEIELQPAERYFRHSELEPQAIEEEPVSKAADRSRPTRTVQKMGWFGAVRGHSRSWAMPPFDRAHTTSYSTL